MSALNFTPGQKTLLEEINRIVIARGGKPMTESDARDWIPAGTEDPMEIAHEIISEEQSTRAENREHNERHGGDLFDEEL